jgi:signal transduction histidine kinase
VRATAERWRVARTRHRMMARTRSSMRHASCCSKTSMDSRDPADGSGDVQNLGDLAVFNRWLCVSRLRAAGGVVVFVALLELLHVGDIAAIPVLAVCAALALFSVVVLASDRVGQAPSLLFHSQHVVDLAGVTVGIGVAATGTPALLFRLLYALVIVPPSLVSVRAGLLVASGASIGHELLLLREHGWSPAVLTSLESLVPMFLFFLIAQQCFFYAEHLSEKNAALARLAATLQRSRRRLAGLVDVARTLNSTLEAPELWARVNRAALNELGAEWAATFLVNLAAGTFRIAALSDPRTSDGELTTTDFPIDRWPILSRLGTERLITLDAAGAGDLPTVLSGGRVFATVRLAGLYRDGALLGCLALGYGAPHAAAGGGLDQLTAIVEHATMALHNAQLLEEARQASVMKSEFVSTISHELRTPLNVIIGYTDMLRDGVAGSLSSPQQEVFERIDTEARGLFELIEATLQVGRFETGRDTVTLTRVALPELVDALHAVVGALPRPAAVALEWDELTDRAGTMVTDVAKVGLIVRNLVSNAFKYTVEGQVAVRMRTTDSHLVLAVADTGIGIAAANLPVIFEMFRQLDSGSARQGGGVGLGLYIVKQMVQRLAGTIEVDSAPGRGSEFRVTLPGYEAEARNRARGAA